MQNCNISRILTRPILWPISVYILSVHYRDFGEGIYINMLHKSKNLARILVYKIWKCVFKESVLEMHVTKLHLYKIHYISVSASVSANMAIPISQWTTETIRNFGVSVVLVHFVSVRWDPNSPKWNT